MLLARRARRVAWFRPGVASVLVVGLAVSFDAPTPAGASAPPVGLETVVVKMASATVSAASVLSAVPGAVRVDAPAGRYVLRVPAQEVPGVLTRLRVDPQVTYAEVPEEVRAAATPNDPCYSGCVAQSSSGHPTLANEQYLAAIGAPSAWAVTHGNGVTVAILDSGVDTSHPDLAGKVVSNVNVCAADDPMCAGAGDPLGHGTHVTGIVAADTDNHVGVASLGWDVHVRMYKVLDNQGAGNTADVATAIYEAVAAGARVINMSLASVCPVDPSQCGADPDEALAVEYAVAHNVVVVAAAGNDGLDVPTFPAAYPGVLGVGATDNGGVVQSFSEWGPAANIAAPGVNIVSTFPVNLHPGDPYDVESGTSMSAPEVSAAAALLIAHDPSLSSLQVAELLEGTARPTTGGNPIFGGLLDVPAALAGEARPPHLFNGYEVPGADGSVYTFGSTAFLGDLAGHHLNKPVVGLAVSGNGLGYWMDATDGGVFNFGDAGFYGSTGGIRLNKPVVGMAATPDGRGYWLVASDGGIFDFGDARFFGSTGNVRLNKPVVGMAATPDGRGYWLVASDGGIFDFGDARFFGSTGNVRLNKPIVGMAATPDGRGYWLVASDGGIFDFGDARFFGSTGNVRLNKPVIGMASTPSGGGYWLVATDGGIFDFGDARFWGSVGGSPIPAPVVGLAS